MELLLQEQLQSENENVDWKKLRRKQRKKAIPKNKPEIDTDVMSNPKIRPYDYIDWSDDSTRRMEQSLRTYA